GSGLRIRHGGTGPGPAAAQRPRPLKGRQGAALPPQPLVCFSQLLLWLPPVRLQLGAAPERLHRFVGFALCQQAPAKVVESEGVNGTGIAQSGGAAEERLGFGITAAKQELMAFAVEGERRGADGSRRGDVPLRGR